MVEQKLLQTFQPTFIINTSDCAEVPARITPGHSVPKVATTDGIIYGQVFPSVLGKNLVEIHDYTIWSKDCGRMDHPFDVEHVSALVCVGASGSKTRYWYAGAHAGTVCDISSGARAETVDAEFCSPVIWISSGKHALCLRQETCRGGCGADECAESVRLQANSAVANIGELGAPANEAV